MVQVQTAKELPGINIIINANNIFTDWVEQEKKSKGFNTMKYNSNVYELGQFGCVRHGHQLAAVNAR